MSHDLLSPEQVAEQLGLHVKTVRNYVRSGRLKAVRIGKQYRISRADLAALTGQTADAIDRSIARGGRHIEVSSIAEIEGVDKDTASRVITMLMSVGNARRHGDQPLRIETIFDQERERLKIIIVGGPHATADLLKLVTIWIEAKS